MESKQKSSLSKTDKDNLIEKQKKWYNLKPVLFEIVKTIKNRELALLNSKIEDKHIATRFLYSSSVKYLQMHLNTLGIMKGNNLINLYRSNAHFKPNSIPVSTYNLKKRKHEKEYQNFNENFNDFMDGFDFIIDIDGKTIKESYDIAKKIKKFYDDNKLPYYIQFSGTRGFHIIIPQDYFDEVNFEKLETTIHAIISTFNMKDKIDISTLNPKGLIKISYSFDSGNIALPLSDEQFVGFSPAMVMVDNVIENIPIRNRGLLLRTHNLSEDELIKNVDNFIS